MESYRTFIIVALLALVILAIPWLQKYRVFQFFSLILGGLVVGFLVATGMNRRPDGPWYTYVVYFLLAGGLFYRAWKFYRTMM